MPMNPRQFADAMPDARDQAVLDRWGVARCDAVDMDSVSSQLSWLMPEESAAGGPEPGSERDCRRRHSMQESRIEDAISLASRAETVHRRDDAWPHGLSYQLEDILEQTVVHQQREQAVVFPMLTSGVGALPARTVDEMIAAHEDLLERWDALSRRTGGFQAPDHACAAWRLLYVLCFKLHLDCQAQVDLENRMLLAGRGGDLRNHTEAPVAPAQRL